MAVVGASPRDTSPGRAVLSNLRAAAFEGSIDLVNPRYAEIEGIKAVKTIQDLPTPPDLVVIATPPQSVPGIVKAAGERGAAAAIIITAGLGHGAGSLADGCEKAARATGLRLVGPNCLGVLSSRAKLNASFAARMPPTGDLALVSQSGAITAGLIEWSAVHGIGFSAVVSLGDMIDVDLGDLLDFFALDGATRAVLLYVESINNARKFMSAARAAARIKPVVVVKSGRHAQGAKAAQTHTGALAGSDAVYEAAFRRAGLLRVLDLDELFAAAETLGRVRPFLGKRLAILTNGGGIGVLAVDRLVDLGGTLAGISPGTLQKLDSALPPIWSRANPVDIAGDADPARYVTALEGLIEDPENDAILVMNVPTALASTPAAARSVAARRAGAPQQPDPVEAHFRRLGRYQRSRHASLRGRWHSELRDRIRCGAGLYAPGSLPRGTGRSDGDAAEPAAGLQAGRRRGARRRRECGGRWTNLARSNRDDAAARGLFHSDRTRVARPQCR
jgi:acetyltransferase